MKKLSLLKPNMQTVYLNRGKGEEINYLEINPELSKKDLENDIALGATHFEEVLKLANKRPTQMVIVDCTNQEQGLMAATYLAGVYNEADNIEIERDKGYHVEYTKDRVEFNEDDYNMINPEDLMEDYFPQDCEEEENGEVWHESAYKLPVIDGEDLRHLYENEFTNVPFAQNNFFMSGTAHNPNRKPYWMSLNKEPVCVVVNMKSTPGFYGVNLDISYLNKSLKRFAKNRHVYLVCVHNEFSQEELNEGEDQDVLFFSPTKRFRQSIYELILEYTAALMEVKFDVTKAMTYCKNLFDGWAAKMGVGFAKGFPKESLLKQILGIKNEAKSELIEKVFRYVLSQDGVGDILTKEDFEIISRFRLLGATDEDSNSKRHLKKMEEELVGLDEVKAQIHSIVDVMKYNKKRAMMGYGSGGFHNVHLMIGAPGTAKTTIAQIMGNIMMEEKLLPQNRFIAINGAELKGMFVGHSAPKTKAYFDNYDIILIDEAYSLTSDKDMDSFSQEALAQLIIEIEKHGLDKLIIFAGYGGADVDKKDNKMLQFLEANPGIRSRINSTIYFKSYSPEEMVDIVHCQAKNGNFVLSHEGDELIRKHFEKRCKCKDFGNGREARSLLENITMEAARRVMRVDERKQTKKMFKELIASDIERAVDKAKIAHQMQDGNKDEGFGFGMN